MPQGRRLLLTLISLIVLTLASFGLAQLPTAGFGPVIAFAIAATKAVLVLTVFMELAETSATSRLAILIALGLIVLLTAGALTDVALR
jgi:caa(3)-type oxidase subunit IV